MRLTIERPRNWKLAAEIGPASGLVDAGLGYLSGGGIRLIGLANSRWASTSMGRSLTGVAAGYLST